MITDPPSVQPVPESGKLEVNLGEEVDMACVAKGVPVPIVSWKNKVNDVDTFEEKRPLSREVALVNSENICPFAGRGDTISVW